MVDWRREGARSGILFGISVLLVAGFWFHSTFYQLGFYPLLLAGGFVTFLVITLARYAIAGTVRSTRPRTTVTLTSAEGDTFLARRPSLVVLRPDAPLPPPGSVAAFVSDAGGDLGRYRVVDAYRRLLGDLDPGELRAAGVRTPEDVRVEPGPWKPETVVLLARLERLREARR